MDTILVVADDSEIQPDGLEALNLVKSISFELVILDIKMLRTDSIQACIKIWKMSDTPMVLIKDLSKKT